MKSTDQIKPGANVKTFTFQKEKFLSGAEEWQVGSVDYLASCVKIRMRKPKGMKKKTHTQKKLVQRAGRDAKEATRNKEDKCVIHFDDNKVVSLCVISSLPADIQKESMSADQRRVAQKHFEGNS